MHTVPIHAYTAVSLRSYLCASVLRSLQLSTIVLVNGILLAFTYRRALLMFATYHFMNLEAYTDLSFVERALPYRLLRDSV